MVQINNTEVLTMYNAWLGGMSHIYLGMGKKLNSGSTFGLQVNYLSSGDMTKLDDSGNKGDSFHASWMAAGLTYAGYIGETISVGASLKNISESIDGDSGSGMAADVGALYSAGEKTKLGLTLQNVGTGMNYSGSETSPFPVIARGGVSYAVSNEEERGLLCARMFPR